MLRLTSAECQYVAEKNRHAVVPSATGTKDYSLEMAGRLNHCLSSIGNMKSTMSTAPRLRVHNKFNSGLYGEVWDGDQPTLGNRKVAVKVIKVEMADKASAKAHALALANLNHQNIVTVHAFEEDFALPNGQTVDAIVMEWLEGETLGQLISKGGMSPALVFRITDACIDAVRYMHSRGVFHGDLHGGNVIIGASFVKVIDVSAADQRSMARYSTITKAALASVDIAYVAGNLRMCLNRCNVDFTPLHKELEKLAHAQTLEDVEAVVRAIKGFDPEESEEEEIEEEDDEANELDALVLKACGETAVQGRFIGEIISTPKVVQQLEAGGYAADDVLDAFEILGEQGFFREGNARYQRFVQLSNYGMETYLQTFYSDYDMTFRAAKVAVIRGLTNDKEIAADINRELPVVQHLIERLRSDYGCTVSSSNMGYQVVEIGAKLRREMKGVNRQ